VKEAQVVKVATNEADPIRQYLEKLRTFLEEIPSVRLDRTSKKKRQPPGPKPDLSVDLLVGEERWEILGEAKASGEPRMIRGTIQQLQGYLSTFSNTYGIVAAPYIGPRSQQICKDARVGYLDLAGNCRLAFGPVFIERKGFSNPKAERRPLRTLFAPKAGRVLRVLLGDPKRAWQVQAMAREANVSLGHAFKVKQRLLDLEYAREEKNGIRVNRAEDLLREWVRNYSFAKNAAVECFAMGEVAEAEHKLATWCGENGVPYAFTLFSGAARVAPFSRYLRSSAYLLADAREVAGRLGWKIVPTGANFTLLSPVDEAVLYGVQDLGGERVVSDVQLYLDLASQRGRGEEAAAFLLEQRLRSRW
jgi:hypothetical protein